MADTQTDPDLQPFVDIPYVDPVAVDPGMVNAESGTVGNLLITPTGVQAGLGVGQVGYSGAAGNEMIFVGDPNNPAVVVGQLFSKTGIHQYGIWTDVGYFTGSITATTGMIGGWTINSTNLSQNNATLSSTGVLTLGTGNNVVVLDSLDTTYRIVVGNATYAAAPFSVTKAGALYSVSGQIGGWVIGATTLSSSTLIFDSSASQVRSTNYIADTSGFLISSDLIEAQNLKARGSLKGVTFQYDVVSAVGGQLMVSNADNLAVDMTALDASTITIIGNTTFLVNDILLIRAIAGSGIQEEWMRVTNVGSAPTYTVTRDLASVYATNSNPAWKKGTTVVVQGSSNGIATYSGGWLRLFGEGANSPYYSVFARSGILYNNYIEAVRVGNLNGIGGFVSDTYGIFIGNYSTGKYLEYDNMSGNLNINGYVQSSIGAFGGDGSDGALAITSGTTTINLGGASFVVKNYTSISITGTGKLAFSNPAAGGTIVQLKSQGSVTLTSSTVPNIDMSGMGAAGGAGGVSNIGFNAGSNGSTGFLVKDDNNHGGVAGGDSTSGGTTGRTGGVALSNLYLYTKVPASISQHYISMATGSGGGGGGGARNDSNGVVANGGNGGNGGGGLIIECKGAWNFTVANGISVAGAPGVNGTNYSGDTFNGASSGGGGGGSGGFCIVLYNTLTANSGSVNTAGGIGGTGGSSTDTTASGSGGNVVQPGNGGGGAGAEGGLGGTGGAQPGTAGSHTVGNAGTAGTGIKTGGGGGSGSYVAYNFVGSAAGGAGGAAGTSDNVLVAQNTVFA